MPRRIYDWPRVQAYYDEGHGFVQCARKFGFSHTAWIKAIKRSALRATRRASTIGGNALTGRKYKLILIVATPTRSAWHDLVTARNLGRPLFAEGTSARALARFR
jgi:hypothetical protein